MSKTYIVFAFYHRQIDQKLLEHVYVENGAKGKISTLCSRHSLGTVSLTIQSKAPERVLSESIGRVFFAVHD